MTLIFVAARLAVAPPPATGSTAQAGLDDGAAMTLIAEHCAVCHAKAPTQPGFIAPPGGHLFENLEQVRTRATLMSTSVASGYMPLGNLTGLPDADRRALTAWLDALEPMP
jgi:uncharacterized membrane protein